VPAPIQAAQGDADCVRRKGDPNTPKLPHWPAVNAKERTTIVFNNVSKVENDPIREQRLAQFSAMNLG